MVNTGFHAINLGLEMDDSSTEIRAILTISFSWPVKSPRYFCLSNNENFDNEKKNAVDGQVTFLLYVGTYS